MTETLIDQAVLTSYDSITGDIDSLDQKKFDETIGEIKKNIEKLDKKSLFNLEIDPLNFLLGFSTSILFFVVFIIFSGA